MHTRYGARGGLALVVALGALVALPAPMASAGTAVYVGGSLTVNGDPAGETITTTFNETTNIVTFTGIAVPGPPPGCSLAAGTFTCTGVTGVFTLNTGGGADTVTATGDIDIDLGAGNDTVTFVDNSDAVITGGADNDTLIAQGPVSSFSSQTEGGAGNDVLRGGPSPDTFYDEPGADTYVGGGPAAAGDITVVPFLGGIPFDSFAHGGATPVDITLDGVANDGTAGEGDNIANDITALRGSDAGDRIDISGGAFGGVVSGGAGDDVIIGSAFGDLLADGQGADDVRGGPGNDRMGSGASFLGEFYPDSDYNMAPSADRFDGGEGDDRLGLGLIQLADPVLQGVGSYGADVLIGGPGNDTVVADARTCLTDPYGCVPHTPHPINISLDDVANDGVVGINLGIDVRSDIESIESSTADDVLTGSAASNTILGGAGNDTINPLGGADAVLGGPGADAVTSRDATADAVDCGLGTDPGVVGDTTDALVGCEGANDLAAPPAAATGADTSAPVLRGTSPVKLRAKKLAKTKAIRLTMTVDDRSILLASATTTALVARTKVLLGETALPPGTGRRTVTIKLSKALTKKVVRKAQRTRKGVAVKATVVAVNGSGLATTRVITVKVVR